MSPRLSISITAPSDAAADPGPHTATIVDQLTDTHGNQFWCAALDQPTTYHTTDSAHTFSQITITVIVIRADNNIKTLNPGQRISADIAYVIDMSLGYDTVLDESKIAWVGTATIDETSSRQRTYSPGNRSERTAKTVATIASTQNRPPLEPEPPEHQTPLTTTNRLSRWRIINQNMRQQMGRKNVRKIAVTTAICTAVGVAVWTALPLLTQGKKTAENKNPTPVSHNKTSQKTIEKESSPSAEQLFDLALKAPRGFTGKNCHSAQTPAYVTAKIECEADIGPAGHITATIELIDTPTALDAAYQKQLTIQPPIDCAPKHPSPVKWYQYEPENIIGDLLCQQGPEQNATITWTNTTLHTFNTIRNTNLETLFKWWHRAA